MWDPYDRYGLGKRRRMEEMRRRAEQEAAQRARAEQAARKAQSLPPHILARFEEELAQARRERDEWADRYDQVMRSLAQEREAIEAEREALQAQIEGQREQLRSEAEAHREQLRAEADNQRERLLRNAEQRAFEANRQNLLRMVQVADNLERALQSIGAEVDQLAAGVRLTHRDFQRALELAGVEPVASVGEPFDPTVHEAVATQPSDQDDGTILHEIAKGYRYQGALLRPAKVVVAG